MAWVWCPECGKKRNMNSEVCQCPECKRYGYIENGELVFTDDEYEEFGIPECCAACGGDYPNCTDGCPMFDD